MGAVTPVEYALARIFHRRDLARRLREATDEQERENLRDQLRCEFAEEDDRLKRRR